MKLLEIKLLTDENISPKVVTFLRQSGFDVIDAKEQQWFGTSDEDLLKIAYREQRFILTHDADFGTLAINGGKPTYGILYLRLKNPQPSNIIRVCKQVFQLAVDVFPGSILVIEETRIRLRHRSANE
jgi:predicted nuclease of predicted toxin-antitoxin system